MTSSTAQRVVSFSPRATRPVATRPALAEVASTDEPAGQRAHFDTHTLIFMEGDPAKAVYRLIDGAIMLYKLLPDGRRQVVELVGSGDVFGSLLQPTHDCSAETLSPCTVVGYDRAALDRSPAFQLKLAASINARIGALHEHAMLLGRKTALERVASFLMRCVPGRGGFECPGPGDNGDCAQVRLVMTRQEIADYLGLTLETVSRSISELRRRGVITLEKNDAVRINDVCSICQLTGTH